MRKENLHKLVIIHGNKIKIFGGIFGVLVMIFAIKTYVNYNTIVEEIFKVDQSIHDLNQEIAYAEKFYSKYLDSEYSMYFLSHKNNILFNGEYIIKISSASLQNEQTQISGDSTSQLQPQESRKSFIKSKIN